ncbi:helix-turn-helix transcriptional regulator [Pseudomonas corrugata]|uniref:XRE family transcriptional regulator n=1 Tax=Pseudomonas corrugata TaxID=47879 RepID=UPI00222FDF19|nr:helix-turn-helix transcriptional regulator [Pseudomonas corrugata]UZD92717.1 helix-turn-helix transcriptional regulator [Pseudomonas corrugata]
MPESEIEKYAQGLAERIRACAIAVGNGEELSRRTGIPRSTLESYLTGDSEPKASRLVAIAQAARANVGWLATGDGAMTAAAAAQKDEDDKYAYIPLYDARVSQGHGAWNDGVKVLTMLAFTKYSLRRKGLNPAELAAVRVDGDSNEPLLSDGDTVMVDLSRNVLQGEAFYVIRIDDLLYAKRLQREFDGSILVISANPAYKIITVPQDRLDSFQIIGRVVWAGGWMV